MEKQRQDDLYSINTVIREKEALAKTDTRRLAEKLKGLFEEFGKNLSSRDIRVKHDLDAKISDLERVSM